MTDILEQLRSGNIDEQAAAAPAAAARIATQQEAIDELVAGLRAFHDYHMSGGHVGELASIEFEGAALLSKHG